MSTYIKSYCSVTAFLFNQDFESYSTDEFTRYSENGQFVEQNIFQDTVANQAVLVKTSASLMITTDRDSSDFYYPNFSSRREEVFTIISDRCNQVFLDCFRSNGLGWITLKIEEVYKEFEGVIG